MKAKRGRPPIRDDQGDVAHERLIKAGAALFSEKPFDSVTADDLAQRAGVARGLLFHYFGSKQGLRVEVWRREAQKLEQIHLEEPPAGVPPEKKLAALLRRHMDFVREHTTAYVEYLRATVTADLREIGQESRLRTLHIVLRYFDIAEPSPRQVALARAWLALFDELVLAWVEGSLGKERVVRISVETFENLIVEANPAARPPTRTAKSEPSLK